MANTNTDNKKYPSIVDRRLMQIRYTMEEHKVDAIVITHMPNIRYLTNFSGSSATMFVLENQIHFITDDRYKEQIKDELYDLPNMKIHIDRDPFGYMKKKKILGKAVTIGFEADKMPYSIAVDIRNRIRPLKFKPGSPQLVEKFTMPKSSEELDFIKKAIDIAENTYEKILGMIEPGMKERDIAIELSYQAQKLGSEGVAFDPLVTSGERGAIVHGKPSMKEIKKNEVILLNYSTRVNGFIADITRVFVIGKAKKEHKDIYKLLYSSMVKAREEVLPGMNGKHLDTVARTPIIEAGYGDYFEHSLGHGIGLTAIENPIITFRMDNQIIPDESVLTIEPGVYIPGQLGMRVEDMIQVTPNGGIGLTKVPEKLLEI
jgi:Xaa-Pro aminopeptidase